MSRGTPESHAQTHRPQYRCVARADGARSTSVRIGHDAVDDQGFFVIAGPCAVESRAQILEAARAVSRLGANALRGGAYKPRTSPYSFQGLGEQGLKLLAEAGQETGLPVVTEILTPEDLPLVCQYADVLQVGARNMQNFALLKALGNLTQPVILKRGMSATIEEFLLAAEYIVSSGNPNVILCERGIRTFETATRNTLDLNAVALLKERTHLPVIVDPSHGTGLRSLVSPLSKAALAVGADGLIVEVHPDPDSALSDGQQSIAPDRFEVLMDELACLTAALGRHRPQKIVRTTPDRPQEGIESHRQRIDCMERAIMNLLLARSRLGFGKGQARSVIGLPACDSRRKQQILDQASALSGQTLTVESIVEIFTAITQTSPTTEEQESCATEH